MTLTKKIKTNDSNRDNNNRQWLLSNFLLLMERILSLRGEIGSALMQTMAQ
jgi:hypothetical protein